MEIIEIFENDILKWLKNAILKYCPKVEDRINLIGDNKDNPKISILIKIYKDKTYITIFYGTNAYQKGIEIAFLDSVIYINYIFAIINYILSDKRVITYSDDKDIIYLNFKINWNERARKGLSVDDIAVELQFANDLEKKKEYLEQIKTQYFVNTNSENANRLKALFIEGATKEEIITYFNSLDLITLKEILAILDIDLFEKYFEDSLEKPTKLERLNPKTEIEQ